MSLLRLGYKRKKVRLKRVEIQRSLLRLSQPNRRLPRAFQPRPFQIRPDNRSKQPLRTPRGAVSASPLQTQTASLSAVPESPWRLKLTAGITGRQTRAGDGTAAVLLPAS